MRALTLVALAAVGLAAAAQKDALRGSLMNAIRAANANAVVDAAETTELLDSTTTGTGGGSTGGGSTTTTGGGGTTTSGGGGTTTSGGGGSGGDVEASFFLSESCSGSPAFALNVSGCADLSADISKVCSDIGIPALLCPYVSVRATCSGGYVKGTLYFSEIKTNGGGICGAKANKLTIPVIPDNTCYGLNIIDGLGVGFAGVCQ